VNEGQVNDGIRSGGADFQTRNILQYSPLHLGPGGGKDLSAGLGTCQAEHLVSRSDQLFHDVGTDKSGSSGYKNTHDNFLLYFMAKLSAGPDLAEIQKICSIGDSLRLINKPR